jgi:hypothetical protein
MWKLRVSGNYNHTLMIGNYYYSLMPIPYYNYIPDYKHDANICRKRDESEMKLIRVNIGPL